MLNPSERNYYAELVSIVGPAAALKYQVAVRNGEFWEPLAKKLYYSTGNGFRLELWYIMQMVAFGYCAKALPEDADTGDYIAGR